MPRGSGERAVYSVVSPSCKYGLAKVIGIWSAPPAGKTKLGQENGLTTTRITIKTINSAGISLKIR